MAEIEIKLSGIAQIKSELRDLKSQLDSATDPEQMAELAKQAGVLSDRLKDANERVGVFASSSPFEQTNNALGLMSSQIMSLDFEGAAESAKLFATAAKGINGQQIATQLKGLGSVVLSVGKAFMSMGAALLTNPIFLIAAAIVGIVTVIGALLNKLGLLKPILDAVGAAFKVVKDVIMSVVQALKDFLDWLGLTSFAAEEAAQRQADAQEKIAKSYADKRDQVVDAYDQEIRLAKIAGENTFDLEKKKQEAIIKTSQEEYKANLARMEFLRQSGELTKEKAEEIRKAMFELKKNIKEARQEIQAINATEKKENKEKNEAVEKADQESYKKRIEAAKRYGEERLAAQRQIRDLEISLLDESTEKEIISINEKYARLVEDIQKNEKLTSDEKKRLIELYAQEEAKARREATAKAEETEEVGTGLLPPPELVAEEMDALVAVTAEGFSKMDQIRLEWNNKTIEGQKAKKEALMSIEQSIYQGAAALGELFIKDSKKLEKFQKAQALIQIGIDTAKAISALVAASQANPANAVSGGLAGIAQFASGIAQILTNVAKAKQLLSNPNASASGGGGGGGSSTSAAVPSATPQVNLFGQNNNGNNVSAPTSMDQSITVKAVVSETEITDTQNKIKGIKELSAL